MANRFDFDWSSVNRDGLAGFLWSLSPKIVNQRLTIKQFHNILYRSLKKHMPIRMTRNVDKKTLPNMVMVGGCYYSAWDQNEKVCIEVSMFYNPLDETLKMNTRRFWRMCYGIADTILHEVIHMRQFRRRDFKELPDYPSTARRTSQREEQEYLGCSDEIDAYGFNVACDLLDRFGSNTKKAINYLDLDQRSVRKPHDSLSMYLKAFNHDHNHIIIKRLKKKVIRYLPLAEIGKPYRNKDWICY